MFVRYKLKKERNQQNMNNANEDDLKNQLEVVIRESSKSSQLSGHKMLYREISI